jgi:hypothetical protein
MAAWTLRGTFLPNKSLAENKISNGDSIWENGTGVEISGRIPRDFWIDTTPTECLSWGLPDGFNPVDHWSTHAKEFSNGAISLIAWEDELEFSLDILSATSLDVRRLCEFALKTGTSFILGANALVYEPNEMKILNFAKESSAMVWAKKFGKSNGDFK